MDEAHLKQRLLELCEDYQLSVKAIRARMGLGFVMPRAPTTTRVTVSTVSPNVSGIDHMTEMLKKLHEVYEESIARARADWQALATTMWVPTTTFAMASTQASTQQSQMVVHGSRREAWKPSRL